MTYNEALEYHNSFSKYDIKLGLDRMNKLIGNVDCKFIHIAGTNGKGTISSIIYNCLLNSGYSVGLFQSPDIDGPRSSIQKNGEYISEEEFAKYMEKIKKKVDNMVEKPTYFEIKTAIALLYFDKCDFACIEVGLGGRFDSTNIIKNKLVSVITAIDYDHIDFLGENIEDIAWHKAGIINGAYAVLYPIQEKEVKEVITKEAKKNKSKLIILNKEDIKIINQTSFIFKGKEYKKSLLGNFQSYNISTAIEALNCLKEMGFSIKNIQKSVFETVLPARMEVISKNPLVILDGAHNVHAIKELSVNIKRYNNVIGIMSVLKDKEYTKMLEIISSNLQELLIVPIENNRAESLEKIYITAKKYIENVKTFESEEKALEYVKNKKFDLLIVFGSLYLASSIRPKLRGIYENR